jgi:(3S)-malyl-CoA thioesterase
VRINALSTEWGADDLDVIAAARPEAILLPKVDGPRISRRWPAGWTRGRNRRDPHLGDDGNPEGRAERRRHRAAPRMAGFILGTNDLAKDLGCRPGPGRRRCRWRCRPA